ncbi:hypothetical protein IT402_00170 [Candidatus Nomurabacteria bacterium]|nr:hypothetical protein [Candidatus Nomurabacteria bacterium]
MTTTQYQKSLQRELAQLNRKIDMMIVKGQSYVTESKKHKMLLRQLRAMEGRGLFGRLASMSF